MNSATMVFNVAAVVACVAIFIALVDLMKHKTKTYGVTSTPVVVATSSPTTAPTVAPSVVTVAP